MLSAAVEAARFEVLATDLDGTLLRSDGSVSPYTRETLLRLRQQVRIVVVTARPIEAARDIALEIGASAAICLSGAITHNVATAQVEDNAPLTSAQVSLLRQEVGRFCGRVAWGYETSRGRHVDQHWRDGADGLAKERFTCLLGRHSGPSRDVLTVLMSCQAHDGQCLSNWLAGFGGDWGAAFSPVNGIVEVTAKTATKAAALARYCRTQRVSAQRVIAFGDSPNDLGMLQWAGLGIAVENGASRLRDAVTASTRSNDADGVAHAVHEYLAHQLA